MRAKGDAPTWFVCFFVGIKPENPYFASLPGREVYPMGGYLLADGPRSYPCGPTKGTPPPGDNLRAN